MSKLISNSIISLILIGLLIILSQAVFSQDIVAEFGRFDVSVIDNNLDPIANVTIKAYDELNKLIVEKKTDKNGWAALSLKPGYYDIEAIADDSKIQKRISLKSQEVNQVSFSFKRFDVQLLSQMSKDTIPASLYLYDDLIQKSKKDAKNNLVTFYANEERYKIKSVVVDEQSDTADFRTENHIEFKYSKLSLNCLSQNQTGTSCSVNLLKSGDFIKTISIGTTGVYELFLSSGYYDLIITKDLAIFEESIKFNNLESKSLTFGFAEIEIRGFEKSIYELKNLEETLKTGTLSSNSVLVYINPGTYTVSMSEDTEQSQKFTVKEYERYLVVPDFGKVTIHNYETSNITLISQNNKDLYTKIVPKAGYVDFKVNEGYYLVDGYQQLKTADSKPVYFGIKKGQTIIIGLPNNNQPIISSITTSNENLNAAGQTTITVTATDKEDETLDYSYSATSGTIVPNNNIATFTRDNNTEPVLITATVKDKSGGVTKKSIYVTRNNVTLISYFDNELLDNITYTLKKDGSILHNGFILENETFNNYDGLYSVCAKKINSICQDDVPLFGQTHIEFHFGNLIITSIGPNGKYLNSEIEIIEDKKVVSKKEAVNGKASFILKPGYYDVNVKEDNDILLKRIFVKSKGTTEIDALSYKSQESQKLFSISSIVTSKKIMQPSEDIDINVLVNPKSDKYTYEYFLNEGQIIGEGGIVQLHAPANVGKFTLNVGVKDETGMVETQTIFLEVTEAPKVIVEEVIEYQIINETVEAEPEAIPEVQPPQVIEEIVAPEEVGFFEKFIDWIWSWF